ncbi:hypothetical protein BJ875DRAFT_493453 [Amylocarpus encephaloides]|uniref:Uncharacterized protein n=1 Tax=Amylocarpus encephaloides TaxID=45428 RepID=A0A9P7YPY8_9HELO|nr:hypothetical protein BJ875DRAFT_493453 [Amylocarpus encephaloides]
MHIPSTLAASLAFTLAAANSITFLSLDTTPRTACFYSAPSHPTIPNNSLPGKSTIHVPLPLDWEGSWQTTLNPSDCGPPGIRGEVRFDGYEGKTYYDVSAIDNLGDNSGVKFLYPASGTGEKSGCESFPCEGAYLHPDDKQTKVTVEKDLVCEVGR